MFKYTFSLQHGVAKVAALLLSLQLGEKEHFKARFLEAPHLSIYCRTTSGGKDYKISDKYLLH